MTKIFGVGTRVVCIDGKFFPFVREFVEEVPIEGSIYTVSEICYEANGWEAGHIAPGFFLAEIPEGLPACDGRICWEAQRFDPIEDTEEAKKRRADALHHPGRRASAVLTKCHPIVA